MRLANAVLIVGKFVKWCIVGILGIAVGVVMFGESMGKIAAWFSKYLITSARIDNDQAPPSRKGHHPPRLCAAEGRRKIAN